MSFIFGKNPRFAISGLICQLRSITSFFHGINICVIQVVNTAFIQRSTFISVTSVVEFGVQNQKHGRRNLPPSPTPIFSIKKRHYFWFLSFKNFTTEVTLTFINNICKILPILQILKIFMATFIAKIVGCHCQKWWGEHLPTAENFANCQWQNYHPLPFSNIANGRSYLIYKERKTCCF